MKKSKEKSRKGLIVLLIIFLLALAIGYAAFNDVLTITGTANANGTFDMEFTSCTVKNAVGVDASADKDTLTVVVKDLAYPGAGAEFDVVITNVGTIPAKIKSVTPTGITGSNNIKITGLDQISTEHPTIEANGTCSLDFTVEWDKNSTQELTETEKNGISFELQVEYEQDAENVFEGTSAHTDA